MFELPTKLTDYRCDLEAVDRHRNIARGYRIRACRDLFGHTIVDLHWGRIGCRGSGLTVSFEDEVAAGNFIKRTLAKRASAPRRFGVPYLLVDAAG